MAHVTVTAPINIAFIKYWGKREGGEELILPTNDSFSITLSTDPFRSKTSVMLTDKIDKDVLFLNGEEEEVAKSKRLTNVLAAVRASCPVELAKLNAFIVSNNNFPTAAGMASSASGYCALACAVVKAFQSTADVSVLSRIGSGSACRSAYGGFVKWIMGCKPDGSDCRAEQFVNNTFWPEMQVMCAVLKGAKKDVGSTSGMQQSLKTSPLMKDRINTVVPSRMAAISEAVTAKDFQKFAEITMVDSDDLQEVCRTTEPRIQYATEDSYAMIRLVHALNKAKGTRVLAYTYDAGANAFLFCLRENLVENIAVINAHFPTDASLFAFNDKGLAAEVAAFTLDDRLKSLLGDYPKKSLEFLLQSPVGDGPQSLGEGESLIDTDKIAPKE